MKKLKSKAGFTLMELLLALLILVFLVCGIGVGMDAGSRIYQQAVFEADSATLAGILNTSLGDILRYSQDIQKNPGTFTDAENNYLTADKVGFVFTNLEYGVQRAYFYTPYIEGGASLGVLQMKNLEDTNTVELVNSGAYPDLGVSNFKITYVEPGVNSEGNAGRGGYFNVSYTIFNMNNTTLSREVETVFRQMNG